MNIIRINPTSPQTEPQQMLNYVTADGETLVRNVHIECVMVRSEADLAGIANDFQPGTIAFTPGGQYKWQLDASREWQAWLG